MRLQNSLSNLELLAAFATTYPDSPSITSIADSSEDCVTGSLFFALRGSKFDGHSVIPDAMQRGAIGVVGEHHASEFPGLFYLQVDDARRMLAKCAAIVSHFPSRRLISFAVTGTNGKTTTHSIIANVLDTIGQTCLRTGTLGAYLAEQCFSPDTLTTPGVLELNSLLSRALEAGAKSWSTEVSSHALSQARVEGIDFDGAIFTNLTRDHLDYHKTMEAYCDAKAHLFTLLGRSTKSSKCAVIHHVDPSQGDVDWGESIAAHAKGAGCQVVTFGTGETVDIQILHYQQLSDGTSITILDKHRREQSEVTFLSPLLGAHNVENIVGAYALLTRTVCDAATFFSAVKAMPQVPGRLERVIASPYQVFVDYAHTPDALARVLIGIRAICKNKLWVLFGCGGDRDKGKRPQMLKASLDHADGVIVTSDNPRTEDPQNIIEEILQNDSSDLVRRTGVVEPDRRIAIHKALALLQPDDILIIAGKGHEDYQVLGTKRVYFSDQAEVREWVDKQTQSDRRK